MYVRSDDDSDKRTHTNPTCREGEVVEENLVLTAAAALRVTNETAAATIANVTVSVTMPALDDFIATMPSRGVPFPALLAMRRPVKKMRRDQRKSFIDRKCCVVSVRRRPAYMAKTPAVLFKPSGSYRSLWFIQSVTPRFKERCAGWQPMAKAYHVVDEAEELAKASGTEHHGGDVS